MAGEWLSCRLGDVLELKRGYDLPTAQRAAGSVPIVSSSGVSGTHDRAMVRGPGVVTGRYGTIGQVFYVNEDFWPLNTTLYVRDFKGAVPRFVAYFLQTLDFLAYSDKAAVPGVNRNHLHQAKVFWPPLPEQSAIAELLGALDDKIELNQRMAETLEAIAQALFKSWFVDFDPVHAKAESQSTNLSADLAALFSDSFGDHGLPKGWKYSSVNDVCKAIFSGGTPSTMEAAFWNGSIPWLSSGETRSNFIIGTEKYITQAGVDNSSTRLAKAGSIVVASAGQGHTRGQTSMLMIDTYINQSVVVLKADTEIISDEFLYFDLKRRYDEFRQLSDGQSSRGSLTTKLLARVRTVKPPRELVQAFDGLVSPIVSRITHLLRQSKSLAELRDTLLPKLISGELRIEDAEKRIVAA